MGAQGTTTINFGAFPGKSDASVAVADAAIGSGSLVESWVFPAATADHTVDEHLVETLGIMAGSVVAGVGFTIYAVNTSQLNEPVIDPTNPTSVFTASATTIGIKSADAGATRQGGGGAGTRIWGVWNVGYVWN